MGACNYKISVRIDDREVEIKETVETNYKDGEAKQLATLFYRTILACGHSPAVACAALAGIAHAGGGLPGSMEEQNSLFAFEQSS